MCDYCVKGKSICDTNREELGIELHSGTCKLIAYGLDKHGWNISVECDIKYCPICGRRLIYS